MARETKVGLLVGMGVILLVGIIVSDHLSTVHDQKPAHLQDFAPRVQIGFGSEVGQAKPLGDTASTATAQRPRTLPTPEEMRDHATPAQLQPPQPVNPDNLPREALRVGGGPSGTIESPRPEVVEPPVAATPPQATPSQPQTAASLAKHTVKSGDTLYQIAKTYYRDPESWKLIADANKSILGPDHALKIGMELNIPKKTAPGSASVASAGSTPGGSPTSGGVFAPDNSDSSHSQPASTSATIEVKPGQTLRVLAAKHLGNAEKWKELLAANKDQLRKAEDLKPGMKLKLPAAQPASSTTARRSSSTGNSTTPSSPSSASPTIARSTTPATEAPSTDNGVFGPTPSMGGTPTGSHASPPVAREPSAPRTSVPWPAASISAATPGDGNTYTVKQGDTLASIAARNLGDRNRWPEIVTLNRSQVSGTGEVQVGSTLKLPTTGNR